jgi:hypothetical protein
MQTLLLTTIALLFVSCAQYRVRDGREPVGAIAPNQTPQDPLLNPITNQPIANQFQIFATPNPAATGTSVAFNTEAVANTHVRWDFGSGGFAQGFQVSHIYYRPGEYNVVATRTHLQTNEILTAKLTLLVTGSLLTPPYGTSPLPPAVEPSPQCQKQSKCCCRCVWVGPIRRWLFGCR